MKTARATSYFASRFLKENWLWIALVLLVLWLLPKLINAYALLIKNAGDAIPKVLDSLNFPKKIGEAVGRTAAKALKFVEKYPVITWIVPVLAWRRFPAIGAALTVWGLLDIFKGDETLTVTRNVSPVQGGDTPAGPVRDTDPFPPVIGDPLDDFYSVTHNL